MTQGHGANSQISVLREKFLSRPLPELPGVRDIISASWRRALEHRVDTDQPDPVFVADPDGESLLVRSAKPVLDNLASELGDPPVAILLTDSDGLVVSRTTVDRSLDSGLDRILLAPGYSYAESSIGTNGIGTTLECQQPVLVSGFEHFNSGLAQFECAGAPIHHPVRGHLVGVLDLTSWSGTPGPLLLTLARRTAKQIEEAMLAGVGARELALLREYLAACQRGSGAILAVNEDVVMVNNQAQELYDVADRSALITHSGDVAGSSKPVTVLADLPSGMVARLEYRPVYSGSTLAGGLFRVKNQAASRRTATQPELSLPGVVGGSPGWRQTCAAAEASFTAGSWLVLTGERGTGKTALATAVARHHAPSGTLLVRDCEGVDDYEEWAAALDEEVAGGHSPAVILRHADTLGTEGMRRLTDLFTMWQGAPPAHAPVWVAVTLSDVRRDPDAAGWLMPFFAHTVEVPPLRHRIEDVRRLVPHLLARHAKSRDLEPSDACLRQLMRLPWPGNIRQLDRMLAEVSRRHRSGKIEVADLPAECRTVMRRQLTQLESIERDAIVRSLAANDGNKERAAADLGMSRATIYRKIRAFGIVPGP
ncbi:GAF domain-containing protein [Amycolatopsis acidiphila]|uniref:sigma-54-dependent Fis family transcriptional regulator n=1 Tax=Amycolatopsis acidiphila TaxID=715473 RepID=UPI0019A9D0A9|nr:GAF domain-containing protein [Amycolatopsis acidiphila]UIJ61149.1 GAF domain-containing protein [Amycolatopsis acidiphila]GHG86425.1 Fis family transcriptional regulator [Amycolatopsis acidiphila]